MTGLGVAWMGYVWWHPYFVLALTISLFSVASLAILGWWRSYKSKIDEAKFNSNALRIKTRAVHLTRLKTDLNNTDPTVTIEVHILNATGRHLRITGIEGRVRCGGDSGLVVAAIDGPIELPSDDSTRGVSFHQVFSPALAQKIIDELKGEGKNVVFDCSGMSLTGHAGQSVVTINLSRATCRVKGPFSLDDNDQANMWPLEYTLVSQERYELWSGNRKH